jgi:hypothetical protein
MLYDSSRDRLYCRNPRCRSKLPAPVANLRDAFCARGCCLGFFRTRCLICEAPIEQPKKGVRKHCEKAQCFHAFRYGTHLGRYAEPKYVKAKSETPDSIGLKLAPKPDRACLDTKAPSWRRIAGPELPEIKLRIPLDGAFADRHARSNNAHWKRAALIGPNDPPVNVLGGYRFPGAPEIELSTSVSQSTSTSRSTSTSISIPSDLSIPRFLLRRGGR